MSKYLRMSLGFMIGLLLCLGLSADAAAYSSKPLAGLVLIVDAGHGGTDPGAHGRFRGQDVYEAPYVNDVALRFEKLARDRGAIVITTRYDASVTAPNNAPASTLLHFVGNHDCFTGDHRRVEARTEGMRQRLAVANDAVRRYRGHKIVFISIHFDAENTASLQGVHVITPSGVRPEIVNQLIEDFQGHGRLRRKNGVQYTPLVVNGTSRKLYILRADTNPVFERALVELGNFGNPGDVYRIRDPKTRQDFANIMVDALEHYYRLPQGRPKGR